MANDPKDSKPANKPPAEQSDEDKRSGRVTFDSRGNSVWEWQLETGVYSRDVNTQKLKKLDLGDLSIAETGTRKKPTGLNDPNEARTGGGFNPYDNAPRPKQVGSNPYDNARSLGNKFAPQAPPQPQSEKERRGPDEMRKLSEWIKMKKNLPKDK